jgi:hypothetical protein
LPGSCGSVRIALFAASFADFRTIFLIFGIVSKFLLFSAALCVSLRALR